MKIGIIHQHDSQVKVAQKLQSQLVNSEVHLIDVRNADDIRQCVENVTDDFDAVVLTIGGRETQFFVSAMHDYLSTNERKARPLILSMTVGLTLDRVFYGTFMFREPADVVLVNHVGHREKVRHLYEVAAKESIPEHKVKASLCPIFDPNTFAPIEYSDPINTICFAVQTDIPSRRDEREYIAQRLIDYARAHPDRKVILKPRHTLDVVTAHVQKYPYETMVSSLWRDDQPENLVISYESMESVIAESDLIVSVSSTALVEAMSSGKRCVALADLGISETLGTSYFLNSGILATFDELIDDVIPRHNEQWLKAELDAPAFHDLIDELAPLATQAREGLLPLSTSFLRRFRSTELKPAARPKRRPKKKKPSKRARRRTMLRWRILYAIEDIVPNSLILRGKQILRALRLI